MTNTQILCFILGWQGGTVHQVAQELDVTTNLILDASEEDMQWLCRQAQSRGVMARAWKALELLRGQIDGGEEARGRDQEISEVIRVLEGA